MRSDDRRSAIGRTWQEASVKQRSALFASSCEQEKRPQKGPMIVYALQAALHLRPNAFSFFYLDQFVHPDRRGKQKKVDENRYLAPEQQFKRIEDE
jgi:hypothetical protein